MSVQIRLSYKAESYNNNGYSGTRQKTRNKCTPKTYTDGTCNLKTNTPQSKKV